MSNVKIKKVQESAFVEDEKKPAKLVTEVKPTNDPNKYIIKVLHPNRQADFTRKVLYEEVHEVASISEAMNLANTIKETQFSTVETIYEEVKFIPKWKKGKMQLDLKEDENKIIETQEPKQVKGKKNTIMADETVPKKKAAGKKGVKKSAAKAAKPAKKVKKQRKG